MKKRLLILMTVCLGILTIVSCNKNNENEGDNGSNDKKISIQYQMKEGITQNGDFLSLSPCFHYNIQYVDAAGKTVEVNNVTVPSDLAGFEVKAPFTAKIEGTIVYNEADLPDTGPIVFGAVPAIRTIENGTVKEYTLNNSPLSRFPSKEQFLDYIATHQDRLTFTLEQSF